MSTNNKKSIWSAVILFTALVSLVLLVITAILTIAVVVAAKEALVAGGVDPSDAAAGALVASIVVFIIFILISFFDILKIIGGFLFALKGKWSIFCIVVALLALASNVASLVYYINEAAEAGNIVIASLDLAASAILAFACLMHRRENKRA